MGYVLQTPRRCVDSGKLRGHCAMPIIACASTSVPLCKLCTPRGSLSLPHLARIDHCQCGIVPPSCTMIVHRDDRDLQTRTQLMAAASCRGRGMGYPWGSGVGPRVFQDIVIFFKK